MASREVWARFCGPLNWFQGTTKRERTHSAGAPLPHCPAKKRSRAGAPARCQRLGLRRALSTFVTMVNTSPPTWGEKKICQVALAVCVGCNRVNHSRSVDTNRIKHMDMAPKVSAAVPSLTAAFVTACLDQDSNHAAS